jgi:phosphopentomutase
VPFLLWGKTIESEFIGARGSFTDVGQSIADFMGIEKLDYGKSIFEKTDD